MEKKQNGLGVAGFVLSLIGCTSFLGVIFSIIALVTGKNKKKGLAIAGLVIGLIWCLIGFLLLFIIGSPNSSISEESKNMTESEYKTSCKEIEYKELFRNIEENKGNMFHFKGQIQQVVSDGESESEYLIAVTKDEYDYWEDSVYVVLDRTYFKDKLLEDDVIDFYGECNGSYSYTSILGESIDVPKISVLYVDLNK